MSISLYWWLQVVFSSCNLIAASPLFSPHSEFVSLDFYKKSQDMRINSFIWFCCCFGVCWNDGMPKRSRYSDGNMDIERWQELRRKVRHHDFFRKLSNMSTHSQDLKLPTCPWGMLSSGGTSRPCDANDWKKTIQSVQMRYQMLYHIFENFMAGRCR